MFTPRGFSNRGVGRKRSQSENVGDFDPGEQPFAENMKVAPLVPSAETTHYSTGDGDWSNTATWSTGTLPGAGDKVLIRAGDTVTYDHSSTARIKWVRVDGTFQAATTASTDMNLYVDTFVVDADATFHVGTVGTPIPSTSSFNMYFADNGLIDLSYDPWLISRGFISFGETQLCGADKTPWVELSTDLSAGATTINCAVPSDWAVGDKVLINPSRLEGHYYNSGASRWNGTESEVHEIDTIAGDNLSFTIVDVTGLEYARTGVTFDGIDYKPHVCNLSRNVRFSTENVVDGFPIQRRGHTMIMGDNPLTDWRNVEFYGLGRTDKSQSTDGLEAEEQPTSNLDNVKGRYVHHYHLLGTTKAQQKQAPKIYKCTAWGPRDTTNAVGNSGGYKGTGISQFAASPGWGFVQHGAGSDWQDNIVFGAFGACYVSEDGDETGSWYRNMSVWSHGDGQGNPKLGNTSVLFSGGHGMAAQGRMLKCAENIGVDCNSATAVFTRGNSAVTRADHQHPELLLLAADGIDIADADTVGGNKPSLSFWEDNLAYASNTAFVIEKANPIQRHDFWTHFKGVTGWNITGRGFSANYTAHYLYEEIKMHGVDPLIAPGNQHPGIGLEIGTNSFNHHVVSSKFEGFLYGINMMENWAGAEPDDPGYNFVNNTFTDCDQTYLVQFSPRDETRWTVYATLGDLPGNSLSLSTTSVTGDAFGAFDMNSITVNDSVRTAQPLGVPTDQGDYEQFSYSASAIKVALTEYGYWTENAGANYITFIPFWVTDSITNNHEVIAIKVNLDAMQAAGNLIGVNNGAYSASPAPSRADITASTSQGVPVDITPLTGASNATKLLSSERSKEAEVVQIGNTITYQPNQSFTGSDTFSLWLYGNGQFVKVGVTVTVS